MPGKKVISIDEEVTRELKIFVESTAAVHMVMVKDGDTIDSVKTKIQEIDATLSSNIVKLLYMGRVMKDSDKVQSKQTLNLRVNTVLPELKTLVNPDVKTLMEYSKQVLAERAVENGFIMNARTSSKILAAWLEKNWTAPDNSFIINIVTGNNTRQVCHSRLHHSLG